MLICYNYTATEVTINLTLQTVIHNGQTLPEGILCLL